VRQRQPGKSALILLHPILSRHAIEVATSIGMALYPVDGNGYEDLLRQSDVALYRDKARAARSRALGAMRLLEADSLLEERRHECGRDFGECTAAYRPGCEIRPAFGRQRTLNL